MKSECVKTMVHVEDRGDVEACIGDNLGLVLAGKGLLPLPCGGRGLCGLCRVKVEGSVSEPTSYELIRGLTGEERLACQVRVLGEVWVRLPRIRLLRVPMFSINVEPRTRDPLVKPLVFGESLNLPFKAFKPGLDSGFKPFIYGDIVLFTRGDPGKILLVDLGTTKIAYQLVDPNGSLIEEGFEANPLNTYGADIVTRMTRIIEEPKLLYEMSKTLADRITSLPRRGKPGSVLVAGNSVMTHILYALPIETLAYAPYQPLFRGPITSWYEGIPVSSAPLIAGYVGGDAYSELVATLELDPPKPYMIIDLGTNTETMLVTSEDIIATSTPAGPAFEGHIRSGSIAYYGGIVNVKVKGEASDGRPVFDKKIIGEPRGLLGTGVISLVAELYRHGYINRTGRVRKGYVRRNGVKAFIIDEENDIVFTQLDIREFQKALAAVKTSWKILLEKKSLKPSDLKLVFIAGSFGSSIEPRDLIDLGLVPVKDEKKIVYAGNMVLTGLRVILLQKKYLTGYREILNRVEHVNLAEEPNYMDVWMKNLLLGSGDE